MSDKRQLTIEQVKAELDRLLAENQMGIVAVPEWKPDGRGGWYLTTTVQLVRTA